jgi:hypothetical protein
LDDGACDSRTDVPNGLESGRCHCKVNVDGRRCDRCKNGFWNFDGQNPEGCERTYRLTFLCKLWKEVWEVENFMDVTCSTKTHFTSLSCLYSGRCITLKESHDALTVLKIRFSFNMNLPLIILCV